MAFEGLQPRLRPWALWLYGQARGAHITSTYRSIAEQTRLYRRFLAGQHAYPVAPPGRSKHNYGLAFDLVASDAELRRLGAIWESVGGTWGGRFHDPIHFEI